MPVTSPFAVAHAPVDPAKFRDPDWTARGEPRARVPLTALTTLWFNTGTLCNLACTTCYIESSPRNDALVYLSVAEVEAYLVEIAALRLPTREIGLTGGEPFLNPAIVAIMDACLARGHRLLVLTNAMRPMRRFATALLDLRARYGERLTLRVSLDHHTPAAHEAERGPRTWQPAIDGLRWLARSRIRVAVAGRALPGEAEAEARAGYARLFTELGLALDADDPAALVLFPAMDAAADTPEISEGCWATLRKSPASVMCATSRMVVRRRGEAGPRIVACTLLPYESGFDLGSTLAEAAGPVTLNHPHCSRFCVLGGASCSAT